MYRSSMFIAIFVCSLCWWINTTPEPKIHIFISFRGTDVRVNMASLLYKALYQAGFNVFFDEINIIIGNDIDQSIEEAIENSLASLVIFSKDFASSEWCLNELVLIMKQKKRRPGYILAPILMEGVKIDDIGENSGSYGKALAEKEREQWYLWSLLWKNKVEEWRAALRQVEACRVLPVKGNWDEYIYKIVKFFRQEFRKRGITVKPRPLYENDHAGFHPEFVYVNRRETKDNPIDLNPKRFMKIPMETYNQQYHQFVKDMKKRSVHILLYILWFFVVLLVCFIGLALILDSSAHTQEEIESIEDVKKERQKAHNFSPRHQKRSKNGNFRSNW